ncbi:MAG: hypothetical protein F7B11_03270 [Caldisphaeraceae archaeon]|nr:hypothetical protein [Caldisphaeraceae archaeon]MEB2792585.1 hypothetical protein [Caldisphaeraceae archaeon]MEB3692421.1 hypothetical protein [Caldisphaeraceae archaeon]MEB3797572.1 hypothetical protein [Caldisphaeraceae archaeon]
MVVWTETPYLNLVYDTIKTLTKNGEVPVSEKEIISNLSRKNYNISPADLIKILIKLELMGYISVNSSTKEDRLIKLVQRIKNND